MLAVLDLEYAATLTPETVLALDTDAGELDAAVERMRGSRIERYHYTVPHGNPNDYYRLLLADGVAHTANGDCPVIGRSEEWAWLHLSRSVTDVGHAFDDFLDDIADIFGGFALIKVTDGEEPIVWSCFVGAGTLRPGDKGLTVASHEDKAISVARAFLLAAIERSRTT